MRDPLAFLAGVVAASLAWGLVLLVSRDRRRVSRAVHDRRWQEWDA